MDWHGIGMTAMSSLCNENSAISMTQVGRAGAHPHPDDRRIGSHAVSSQGSEPCVSLITQPNIPLLLHYTLIVHVMRDSSRHRSPNEPRAYCKEKDVEIVQNGTVMINAEDHGSLNENQRTGSEIHEGRKCEEDTKADEWPRNSGIRQHLGGIC